ncbi:MAG: hypothetical protein ABIJ21_01075 [Nanoarchaeota archaeon]
MDDITRSFVELSLAVGELAGRDNLESQILAILFIEPEEIAMDELARMTRYSLASVCNKVHQLERAGIIVRRSKPGTKKVFLYMEKDTAKALKNTLKAIQNARIKLVKERLPNIIEKHKKANPKKIDILRRHLQYLNKMDAVIDHMLEEFDKMPRT